MAKSEGSEKVSARLIQAAAILAAADMARQPDLAVEKAFERALDAIREHSGE